MDIIEFAEKYCYVRNLGTGESKPIQLYETQKHILKKLVYGDNDYTVKNQRQSGMTTLLAIYMSWFLIFYTGGKNTMYFKSMNERCNADFFSKVRDIIKKYCVINELPFDCYWRASNNKIEKYKCGNCLKVYTSYRELIGRDDIKLIYSLVLDNFEFIRDREKLINDFKQACAISKHEARIVQFSTNGCSTIIDPYINPVNENWIYKHYMGIDPVYKDRIYNIKEYVDKYFINENKNKIYNWDLLKEMCDYEPKPKPPLGILKKELYDTVTKLNRLIDIKKAVFRYMDAEMEVPVEWINEYNELTKKN